jgi:hypothetical protein
VERPTLDEIRDHSFLKAEAIPTNLPDYILHRAPIYPEILYGGMDLDGGLNVSKKKRNHDDDEQLIENAFSRKKSRYVGFFQC